jgi:hypothetical protein
MWYWSSGEEDDDELHPMTRALNDAAASRDDAADANGGGAGAPRPTAAAASQAHATDERHVCPFCGSLNASPISSASATAAAG